jgi:hypothetical protein
MLKMRMPLLFAAVVCAFALSAAPAMAFTEFQQKQAKSGNQGKGPEQVFKTKAGEVKCTEVKSNGGSTQIKSGQAFVEAKYENCTAFTFVGAEISPAKYNFHAQGKVSVTNTILIKASGCEVEVSPEGNKEQKEITFTNNNPGITLKSNVTGIVYKVNKNGGGLCGTVGSASNGEYKGEAKTETYSGELPQWNGIEEVKQLSYSALGVA